MSHPDTFLTFATTEVQAVMAEHRGETPLVQAEFSTTGGYGTAIALFNPELTLDDSARCYLLLQFAETLTKQAADNMQGSGRSLALAAAGDLALAGRTVDPSVTR